MSGSTANTTVDPGSGAEWGSDNSTLDTSASSSDQAAAYDAAMAEIAIMTNIATVICVLCSSFIVLSSRHLYAKTMISKLPLIASLTWLCSAILTEVSGHNLDNNWGYTILPTLSSTADLVSRSIILWFTFFRVCAVWPHSRLIMGITIAIQIAQIASFTYVLYIFFSWLTPASYVLYLDAVAIYAASDWLVVILDVILLYRLWTLNAQLTQTSLGKRMELVKPRFFYSSIVTVCLIIAITIAMAVLFVTENDPFWSYNSILFASRIMFTDILSNQMRDSLIEAHADAVKAPASATDSSSESQVQP